MYFDTYNQDWNWIKLKEIKSNQDICDNTQPYKKHKKCIIKYMDKTNKWNDDRIVIFE